MSLSRCSLGSSRRPYDKCGAVVIKITMNLDGIHACIVMESPADIKRMQKIFAVGINCMSDRGRDVEYVADALLDAAKKSGEEGK